MAQLAHAIPVRHVFAYPPRAPVVPLALEPADVAAVGLDFVPQSFTSSIVRKSAALLAREGDFAFSPMIRAIRDRVHQSCGRAAGSDSRHRRDLENHRVGSDGDGGDD